MHYNERAMIERANIVAGAACANAAPTDGAASLSNEAARPVPVRERERAFAQAPLDDEHYMLMAIDEARKAEREGEVPIGAVVVWRPVDPATLRPTASPRVIARGRNLRETLQDPSAHAEVLALREAARELGVWRLSGCTVYVTLEPCLMCAGLMQQARIDRCVYGARDAKAGALGTLYAVHEDNRLNHAFPVLAGVRGDECAALLKDFFARKRQKRAERKA